jgi:hypothetical protein
MTKIEVSSYIIIKVSLGLLYAKVTFQDRLHLHGLYSHENPTSCERWIVLRYNIIYND